MEDKNTNLIDEITKDNAAEYAFIVFTIPKCPGCGKVLEDISVAGLESKAIQINLNSPDRNRLAVLESNKPEESMDPSAERLFFPRVILAKKSEMNKFENLQSLTRADYQKHRLDNSQLSSVITKIKSFSEAKTA